MGDNPEWPCPTHRTRCGKAMDDTFCHGKGICCNGSSIKEEFCVCYPRFDGKYCEKRRRQPDIARSEEEMHRTELIAAFSAILGVVVILLFVALIFLQVKYYRQRKKRRDEVEHETDRIPKPEDSGSKWLLRNEPGYSWRESVRRSSKAYQKLNGGPLSRSVPEDLFKMGVKIALLGMKGGEGKNNDVLGRCFSADASSGGGGGGGGGGGETFRYSKLQETERNDDDKEKKTNSDQRTEDMIG